MGRVSDEQADQHAQAEFSPEEPREVERGTSNTGDGDGLHDPTGTVVFSGGVPLPR